MEIQYDPAKNAKNIRERGLSFERAMEFDFTTAEIHPVLRHGEMHFLATGFLDDRLYVLVFIGVDSDAGDQLQEGEQARGEGL